MLLYNPNRQLFEATNFEDFNHIPKLLRKRASENIWQTA